MLSKSQKVEGVRDSSVFQAGGDIHVGLTYTEVKDLCQTLIAAEVGRLTHEIVCKDYSVVGMESMFDSDIYRDLHYSFKRLPVLTYEYGIDGYSLFEEYMDPIWTEWTGFV